MNSLPYFGRAWNIQIQTQGGDTLVLDSNQNPGLRVSFSVDTYLYLTYWTAEIKIFNLSSATQQSITRGASGGITSLQDWFQHWTPMATNTPVTISAGYANDGAASSFNPKSNLLFQGKVLQTIWLRPDVIDNQLTLRCVVGLFENSFNFVLKPGATEPQGLTVAPGGTVFDAVNQLLAASHIPLASFDATAKTLLEQQKLPRGQSTFDRPFSALRNLLSQNKIFGFMKHDGIHLRSFDPASLPTAPDFAYAPPNLPWQTAPAGTKVKYTLLGVPEQTQDGVQFRVLMDSGPQIGDMVQLAPGTIINAALITPGKLPPIASRTGMYIVAGIRYVGDTRGNEWHTEISGLSADYFSQLFTSKAPGT